nr:hypothetical protein [uncultured Arsenicibacter sp.]
MEQVKDYLERYKQANRDDRAKVLTEYQLFLETLNEADRQQARTYMQAALKPRIEETVNELDTLQEKANLVLKGKITYEGQEYLLGDWVTIADYCRIYNFRPSRVQNWINRKVIPSQNVLTIKELNNLKLLKNISYR